MARVLVLDPDPDIVGLAAESLAEIGHAIVHPRDAEAGAHVDVLLVACCETRARRPSPVDDRWTALPFVCVGDEPVAVDRRCPRTAAYLVRPYTLEALAAALDRALPSASAAGEL